ncbi:MAG TPA: dienelactone hydrolase family protein [Pyrinomonadaceae bacterium]|jgi:predicted peptidase
MRNDFSTVLSAMMSSAFSRGKAGEILKREVSIENETFVYQVYVPPEVKNGATLPLVTFLHGIRERGQGGFINGMFATLAAQYLKQVPAVVVFPQCRPNRYWSDALMDKMVMRQIADAAQEFSADVKKQSLFGVSMGGYGVWHFGAAYPQKFAALVSICGGSPLTSGNRFSAIAEKVGKTPAWVFHGADDNIVQVSESRSLVAAIRANQGNVKYSEYAGVGHNVWLNALGEKELLPWILAQKSD